MATPATLYAALLAHGFHWPRQPADGPAAAAAALLSVAAHDLAVVDDDPIGRALRVLDDAHVISDKEKIAGFVRGKEFVTISQVIWGALRVDTSDMTRTLQRHVGQILRQLGWQTCMKRVDGKPTSGFKPVTGRVFAHDPVDPTVDELSALMG